MNSRSSGRVRGGGSGSGKPGPLGLRDKLGALESDLLRVTDETDDRELAALTAEVRALLDEMTAAAGFMDTVRALRDRIADDGTPQLRLRSQLTGQPPQTSEVDSMTALLDGVELALGGDPTNTDLTLLRGVLGQLRQLPAQWGAGPAAQDALLTGLARPSELATLTRALSTAPGLCAGLTGAAWQASVSDGGATVTWTQAAAPLRVELHAAGGGSGWVKLSRGAWAIDGTGRFVALDDGGARIPLATLTDALADALLRRLQGDPPPAGRP